MGDETQRNFSERSTSLRTDDRVGFRVARHWVLVVSGVFLATGCSHENPVHSSPASAVVLRVPTNSRTAELPSVVIGFCAFGGVGVIPSNVDPGSMYRVLAWLSVRSSVAMSGVGLRAVEITGEAGVEATLRRVEGIVRLGPEASLSGPAVWRSRGVAFDGRLLAGETKLRIEAWITHRPRSQPSALRLVLGNDTASFSARCLLDAEWPTG